MLKKGKTVEEVMGSRRESRETALQGLYSADFHNNWAADSLQFIFEQFKAPVKSIAYAMEVALGVSDNIAKIDSIITCASEHWSVSRMSRMDRTILRMATYEMAFSNDVPFSVAINEAIEIAKRFGTEDSPTFINGVLDRVAHSLEAKVAA